MLDLGQGFLVTAEAPPHRTPSEARKKTFPQGIPGIFGVWRNPRTGTFLASEDEPRTSGDIQDIQLHRAVCELLCAFLNLSFRCHPTAGLRVYADNAGKCSLS